MWTRVLNFEGSAAHGKMYFDAVPTEKMLLSAQNHYKTGRAKKPFLTKRTHFSATERNALRCKKKGGSFPDPPLKKYRNQT